MGQPGCAPHWGSGTGPLFWAGPAQAARCDRQCRGHDERRHRPGGRTAFQAFQDPGPGPGGAGQIRAGGAGTSPRGGGCVRRVAAPAGRGGADTRSLGSRRRSPAESVPRCPPASERQSRRPPARPIPAARPPHAALTLERRRRIEELSRSSRQRLLQSRDRMFSKFTSILQHAVEAVRPPAGPATPHRGCEPGPAAERAPRGAGARSGRPGPVRSLSAVPRACRLPRGSLPEPGALPSGGSAGSRGPADPGSPVPRGREAEAELPAQAAASGGPERCPPRERVAPARAGAAGREGAAAAGALRPARGSSPGLSRQSSAKQARRLRGA